MTKRVDVRRAAEADLFGIWNWGVDRFGYDRADAYQRSLYRIFALLAAHPGLGRRIATGDSSYRVHPTASQVVIYRSTKDRIEIVRVLGSRQDWRSVVARPPSD